MRSYDGKFQFEVWVHGRPVREYSHDGQVFVEGRIGSEFSLHFTNNSYRRVTVLASIDGLSIMDGESAARGRGQGYIINPHSNVDIPCWRLNNAEGARFVFDSRGASYAAQTGRPDNIGVMGAQFYFEKEAPVYVPPPKPIRPWPDAPWPHERNPHVFGGGLRSARPTSSSDYLSAGEESEGVGTGFGRRVDHHVTEIPFEREPFPATEIILRYDTAEGLQRRGIQLGSPHYRPDRVVEANPFPGSGSGKGCRPPANWRG